MVITSARSLLQPATRQAFGAAVAAGDTVLVPSATPDEIPQLHSHLTSPESLARVAGIGETVTLHSATWQRLEYERGLVGSGVGAAGGVGVGLILSETLKQTAGIAGAPIGVTIGCALVGWALGFSLGSGLVSEIGCNPTTGELTVKAAARPA